MNLVIDGAEKEVRLAFTSTEYNCSVKLVGRLEIQTKAPTSENWSKTWVDQKFSNILLKKDVKDTLIREFASYATNPHTYKRLQETSPYFPNDSGKYRPNYLLYADSINMHKVEPWYTDFKHLIRELQTNSYHGFKVFELPMYTNNTYSMSFHPSKVWGIVPPSMVGRLIIPGVMENSAPKVGLQSTIANPNNMDYYSPEDFQAFNKIIS